MTEFDPTEYGASGIAGEYEELYSEEWDTEGSADFLTRLAGGGSVLEFGIGTGRLALALVAQGLQVHGIDASPEMVAQLRSKPGGDVVPVVFGDFSTVRAGTGFSVVVLAFNTIFALPDQQAQVDCFRNAAAQLRPGGAFVVEAWVPDVGAFRNNRSVRPRVTREQLISIETAVLDPVAQIMRTTQAVISNDSVRLYPANHRYAWPAELDLMAQLAGMTRSARWQDWREAPFTADSRTHVSVYHRPEIDAP